MNRFFYPRLAFTNMKKNSRNYIPYLLSCTIAVAMNYIINFLVYNPDVHNIRGGDTLQAVLGLGTFVAAVFFIIFLFYTNSFLIKNRKREFGLLNILGMEKKHICLMMFWETIYTAVVSFGIGFPGGILLSKVILLILMKMLSFQVPMGFSVSGISIATNLALFGFIYIVCLLKNLRQVHTASPAQLLTDARAGEKEPRSNWILALIGVFALGFGYYIAVATREPSAAIFLFFAAVFLVIIGTFCLFTAGSTVFLKMLRKRKSFYYQTRHFISVSGMLYRMKRNAAGLACICILSTAVIIMISGTLSLYSGMSDVVRTRFPRNIIINIRNDISEEAREGVKEIVDDTLARYGADAKNSVDYRYLGVAGLRSGNAVLTDMSLQDSTLGAVTNVLNVYYIPLEDYNRMTGENYTLKEGEALVYSNRDDYAYESLNMLGMEFQVKEKLDTFMDDGADTMRIINSLYVIVKDETILDALNEAQIEVYGKMRSEPVYYIGFDLGLSDAEQKEVYRDLRMALKDRFASCSIDCAAASMENYMALNGGLFFLGIFLGTLFVLATILIIYYKQVMEGYEDRERFTIMRKVGLEKQEIRSAIRSQVLLVFFLPLVTAVIHVCFAFPFITLLLQLLSLQNVKLFAMCTLVTVLIFAVLYAMVYAVTARVYYRIQVDA